MPKKDAGVGRQRYPKLAPLETTARFLDALDSYLASRSSRKKSTMTLLGCSPATATRLISRRKPRYNKRVRLEWVHRLCNAVGKPYATFVREGRHNYEQTLKGWAGMPPGRSALKAAADLAFAVSVWASDKYQLHGHYVVAYEGLRPLSLVMEFSPVPHMAAIGANFGMHRILLYDDSSVKCMQLSYQPPAAPVAYHRDLSVDNLEFILKQIYASTKNYTAHLARRT